MARSGVLKGLRTSLGRGGEDNWQVECLGQASVCKNLLPEVDGLKVVNDVEKADLVVNDGEGLGVVVSVPYSKKDEIRMI